MKNLLILLLTTTLAYSSYVNITDMIRSLLPYKTIGYQVGAGYEDINWHMSSAQASMFYTLWECSTKRFADHSTPLIFYLAGGPGLSSQFSAFRESGPIEITYADGAFKAAENPWAWNNYAHIVYLDQPVGTGFSFNNGKTVSSTARAAEHFANFLYNFFKNDRFGLSSNPIYLAGEGYAGKFIPAFFQAINSNSSLRFNFEGIILGGGFIDPERQINHYESFLISAGIVGQKMRNLTNANTISSLLKIRNSLYSDARPYFDQVTSTSASQSRYNGMEVNNYRRYSKNMEGSDYVNFLKQRKSEMGVPNDVTFVENNQDINSAFSQDILNSYIHNLEYALNSGKRVLIWNGQNDFVVNTAGVVEYLQNLQWNFAKDWRSSDKEIWKEAGNMMGWVKKFKNLIFVIVKNKGHYVYEDETTSAKAIYLVLSNYFSKKW